jgi:hypothetical protein
MSTSTGKPVPRLKPQRGVIRPACGQRPRLPSGQPHQPCRGDIDIGGRRNNFAPSGLGRWFGIVPGALP